MEMRRFALPPMPKVLVLDANQRAALAVIRSLGKRGLTVIAADPVARSIGAASRYASQSIQYPNPADSVDAFINQIIAIVDRFGVDAIVPVTDVTMMALVGNADRMKPSRLVAPTARSYESLTDKVRLLGLAASLGIQTPTTRIAANSQAAFEAAIDIGFPVVLKPGRSRYLKADKIVSTCVEIIDNHQHLRRVLDRVTWLDDIPCLVQEFIPGRGAGICTLVSHSKSMIWFAHRRIREKPPGGGVSVLSESVPIDPVLQSIAEKLLTAAEWLGVAMVEFRIGDNRVPYLMEINGRFWGSLQLPIDCGLDFPWLAYQIAMGIPVDRALPYKTENRLRWLLGDIDSMLISRRTNTKWGRRSEYSIWAFLRTFFDLSCRQEILRVNDPRPAIREFRQWLSEIFYDS